MGILFYCSTIVGRGDKGNCLANVQISKQEILTECKDSHFSVNYIVFFYIILIIFNYWPSI